MSVSTDETTDVESWEKVDLDEVTAAEGAKESCLCLCCCCGDPES